MNFIEAMEEMKKGKTVQSGTVQYSLHEDGKILERLECDELWETSTRSYNDLILYTFEAVKAPITDLLDFSLNNDIALFKGHKVYCEKGNWFFYDGAKLTNVNSNVEILNLDNWERI